MDGFERYSQFPAKVALQLMRSTWGNPFQTCRGGGSGSWKSKTNVLLTPLTTRTRKSRGFGSAVTGEKRKGGGKVGNPTQSNNTRKSLGFTPEPPY